MKNKIILLLLPILLTSCAKNKNAIYVPLNGDLYVENTSSFINVEAEDIINLMTNKFSFILYQMSSSCSHCEDSSSNFKKYFKNNKNVIYKYDEYMSRGYGDLHEFDEEAFPEPGYTPRVVVIKDGKYVDEIDSSKLTTSSLFNNSVNAFIKEKKNLTQVTTVESFTYAKEMYANEYNLVVYDSKTGNNKEEYFQVFEKEYTRKAILIDLAFADNSLIESISN